MAAPLGSIGAAAPLEGSGAAGPVGLIAAALAGGATYAELFGDQIALAGTQSATMKDGLSALASVLGEELQPGLEYVRAAIESFASTAIGAFDGIPISLADIAAAAKSVANALIGAFTFAFGAIKASVMQLPPAIAEAFLDMVNGAIRAVEALVNRVSAAINVVIAKVNELTGASLAAMVDIDLGRVTNTFTGAGEAARKAFMAAGGQLGRDFIGEANQAFADFDAKIRSRAQQLAEIRLADAEARDRQREKIEQRLWIHGLPAQGKTQRQDLQHRMGLRVTRGTRGRQTQPVETPIKLQRQRIILADNNGFR